MLNNPFKKMGGIFFLAIIPMFFRKIRHRRGGFHPFPELPDLRHGPRDDEKWGSGSSSTVSSLPALHHQSSSASAAAGLTVAAAAGFAAKLGQPSLGQASHWMWCPSGSVWQPKMCRTRHYTASANFHVAADSTTMPLTLNQHHQ